MITAKRWTVVINLDEHDGHTRAVARLQTRDGERVGVGLAHRRSTDREVPEIGDELATARALAELSSHLFACAAADIGENTGERDLPV